MKLNKHAFKIIIIITLIFFGCLILQVLHPQEILKSFLTNTIGYTFKNKNNKNKLNIVIESLGKSHTFVGSTHKDGKEKMIFNPIGFKINGKKHSWYQQPQRDIIIDKWFKIIPCKSQKNNKYGYDPFPATSRPNSEHYNVHDVFAHTFMKEDSKICQYNKETKAESIIRFIKYYSHVHKDYNLIINVPEVEEKGIVYLKWSLVKFFHEKLNMYYLANGFANIKEKGPHFVSFKYIIRFFLSIGGVDRLYTYNEKEVLPKDEDGREEIIVHVVNAREDITDILVDFPYVRYKVLTNNAPKAPYTTSLRKPSLNGFELCSQRNSGYRLTSIFVDALEYAYKHTKGEYFFFMEDDVRLVPSNRNNLKLLQLVKEITSKQQQFHSFSFYHGLKNDHIFREFTGFFMISKRLIEFILFQLKGTTFLCEHIDSIFSYFISYKTPDYLIESMDKHDLGIRIFHFCNNKPFIQISKDEFTHPVDVRCVKWLPREKWKRIIQKVNP